MRESIGAIYVQETSDFVTGVNVMRDSLRESIEAIYVQETSDFVTGVNVMRDSLRESIEAIYVEETVADETDVPVTKNKLRIMILEENLALEFRKEIGKGLFKADTSEMIAFLY
jgi:hypothetical protein